MGSLAQLSLAIIQNTRASTPKIEHRKARAAGDEQQRLTTTMTMETMRKIRPNEAEPSQRESGNIPTF